MKVVRVYLLAVPILLQQIIREVWSYVPPSSRRAADHAEGGAAIPRAYWAADYEDGAVAPLSSPRAIFTATDHEGHAVILHASLETQVRRDADLALVPRSSLPSLRRMTSQKNVMVSSCQTVV